MGSPLRDGGKAPAAVRLPGGCSPGLSNAGIAKTLHLSERAVEKHITGVFQKLGLTEEGELNRRVSAVITDLEAAGRRQPGLAGVSLSQRR